MGDNEMWARVGPRAGQHYHKTCRDVKWPSKADTARNIAGLADAEHEPGRGSTSVGEIASVEGGAGATGKGGQQAPSNETPPPVRHGQIHLFGFVFTGTVLAKF